MYQKNNCLTVGMQNVQISQLRRSVEWMSSQVLSLLFWLCPLIMYLPFSSIFQLSRNFRSSYNYSSSWQPCRKVVVFLKRCGIFQTRCRDCPSNYSSIPAISILQFILNKNTLKIPPAPPPNHHHQQLIALIVIKTTRKVFGFLKRDLAIVRRGVYNACLISLPFQPYYFTILVL